MAKSEMTLRLYKEYCVTRDKIAITACSQWVCVVLPLDSFRVVGQSLRREINPDMPDHRATAVEYWHIRPTRRQVWPF